MSSSYGANPSLYKLPFDPVNGFEPITLVSQQPFIAVVHPSLPVKSVKDLIALAQAKPGELSFASSGAGGIQHLALEFFKSAPSLTPAGPYRARHRSTDLIAATAHDLAPYLDLNILTTRQLRRLAVLPPSTSALPTPDLIEAGVPGTSTAVRSFRPAHDSQR